MNKKIVEKLIPIAIDEIEKLKTKQDSEEENKFFEIKDSDGKESYKIYKEYEGYISSFGASIIQSGLLSTVVFYEARDANTNRDRSKINKLILNVIFKWKEEESEEYENLQSYILKFKDCKDKSRSIKEEIINAAIAIKLAMRVFEFTGNDESQVSN